eukprot:7514261-Karenia_brevis.AAC.1
MVGAHLAFQGAASKDETAKLIEDSMSVAKRITWLPLPFFRRALIVQGGVLPKALFACEVNAYSGRSLAKLRTAVVNAIWGRGCAARCREIIFTLLVPGHLCDPQQFIDYR